MTFLRLSSLRKLGQFLLLACALVCSRAALAGNCAGGPTTVIVPLPATISVPRDAAPGQLISNWVASPATTNYWTCSIDQYKAGGVRDMIGIFNTNSGLTASDANGTYTVWNTNVPGVGIAIGMRFYVNTLGDCSGSTGWYPWGTPPTSWLGIGCPAANFAYTATYGSQVSVALVKTGAVATGGTISGTFAQTAPVLDTTSNTVVAQAVSYQLSNTKIVPLTCTTPDVNVPMGTFKTSDFPSVGSLSPGQAAAVNIQLLNCPSVSGASTGAAGTGQINAIQYTISPTAGTLVTNVASLMGSGSATGVGIQLFTSSGAVFPLNTMQTLSGYNPASGDTYTIPLTARYYRTGTMTPGTGNTDMTLTINYQ